jgi:hypothetical protein
MRSTTARATESSFVFAALPSQLDGTCSHEDAWAATETPFDLVNVEYSNNEQALENFAQQPLANSSYHWNCTLEANAATTGDPFGSSWGEVCLFWIIWCHQSCESVPVALS